MSWLFCRWPQNESINSFHFLFVFVTWNCWPAPEGRRCFSAISRETACNLTLSVNQKNVPTVFQQGCRQRSEWQNWADIFVPGNDSGSGSLFNQFLATSNTKLAFLLDKVSHMFMITDEQLNSGKAFNAKPKLKYKFAFVLWIAL